MKMLKLAMFGTAHLGMYLVPHILTILQVISLIELTLTKN